MTDEVLTASPASEYAAGLLQGRLRFQHCDSCERAVFYPRVLCSYCGSTALSWRTSSGHGVVYSATVVRSRSGSNPVALIDLEEGFRMMCRLQRDDDAVIGVSVVAVVPVGSTLDSLTFTREDRA